MAGVVCGLLLNGTVFFCRFFFGGRGGPFRTTLRLRMGIVSGVWYAQILNNLGACLIAYFLRVGGGGGVK